MIYSIDFETRSKADLPEVGLDNYANHETTEVLCIAFGTTPDNVHVSSPHDLYPEEDFLDHVRMGGKIAA